jgi:uncharacterized protein (DUF433 family)
MVHERIEIDPAVMSGRPVIKGTRITVEHIVRELEAGMGITKIIADHPRLKPGDIYAAAAFADDYLTREGTTFAEGQPLH